MNTLSKTLFLSILTPLLFSFGGALRAQDIDTTPPVVVKTVPEAGTKDVAAGEVEIKVTFSREMKDQSWSWVAVWKDSVPQLLGKPHYEADHKTCVVKAKLEAGKSYGIWFNQGEKLGFTDAQGRVAVPYLLVFQVK